MIVRPVRPGAGEWRVGRITARPRFLDKSSNNRYTSNMMATKPKTQKKNLGGAPPRGPDHPLSKLRVEKKYTRAALAELLGITVDQVVSIEHARSQFPAKKIRRLAEVFGLKINDKLIRQLYPE